MNLAQKLAEREVSNGQLAMYWLCQARFAFKAAQGPIVYLDPYFSDVVERLIGFKRMMACPMDSKDAPAGLVVCTHEHLDHMDTDALPVLAANAQMHFAGPVECMKEFEHLGIAAARCHLLEEEKTLSFQGVDITAVYADHGELAPDALGVVLDFGGIRVYHTGDTAYRPEDFAKAIALRPHILLPCINGAFGNMNAEEAAQLTALTHPNLVVPTHFWMFVEQNGNPGLFLDLCRKLAPETRALLLKPGEECIFELPA